MAEQSLFFNPAFEKLLSKDLDVETHAEQLSKVYRLPDNTAENLKAMANGQPPTNPAPVQTLQQHQQDIQPPTDEEGVKANKSNWKNFITAMREDADLRSAVTMFGAQLAQGPQPNESGVGGMFGRALAGGVQHLEARHGARADRALKGRAIGVQEGQLDVAREGLEVTKQQSDIKTFEAIVDTFGGAEGQRDKTPGLTGEIGRLTDMWLATGKYQTQAEAQDAATMFMLDYNTLKTRVSTMAKNAPYMSPEDITAAQGAAQQELKQMSTSYNLSSDEVGVLQQKLGELRTATSGDAPSRHMYEGVRAAQAFRLLLEVNGNPQPGTPLYEQALQEIRTQAPDFDPLSVGTIRR